MVKVIAEIGWNHCGDMELAKEMILAAKESGATYAKFQSWSVSRLKSGAWDEDGRREIYKKAELTKERHLELIEYCNKVGIKFLSSVFGIRDAELLVELGVKEVKIPSFESRNQELINYCDANFDTVFMSTGTSTLKEIEKSTGQVKLSDFHLLHCVSTYPCSASIANLPRMNALKRLNFPVGYSDHIQGVESAKVAIGEGARVIEKHFTIDNDLPGRDNKFAVLPVQMKDLTDYLQMREEMLNYHGEDFQQSELDSRNNYTGRFDG
jgi:sialic acid synthase SpsE